MTKEIIKPKTSPGRFEQVHVALIQKTLIDVEFDRNFWRKVAVTEIAVIVMLSAGLMLSASNVFTPTREYFATSATGHITPIIPLNQPSVTAEAAKRFAVSSLSQSLSLNFRQYRGQLSEASKYFTTQGYRNFIAEIDRTSFAKNLEAEFLTSSVSEIDKPIVVAEGLDKNGVYGYVVEVPMSITLESKTDRRRQDLKLRITVVRVPTHLKPEGISIEQVVMS